MGYVCTSGKDHVDGNLGLEFYAVIRWLFEFP